MTITISIDGADNVGKTTQIGFLPHHWTVKRLMPLHKYDRRLDELIQSSQLKEWWWSCEDQEFVSVIFGALENRQKSIESFPEAQLVICDRGTRMFEAVAAATIAFKNGYGHLEEGRSRLLLILEQKKLQPMYEKVSVLLKHHENVNQATAIGLSREAGLVDERYKGYQVLLHQELAHQERLGHYHHVLVGGDLETYRSIQDRLRLLLAEYALPHVFVPVLSSVKTVYAIGGLSESGKSTLAAELVGFHGSSAQRLKIGYLLNMASEKLGKDIYELSAKDQAFALVNEIQAYAQAHYWLKYLTIESVHRFQSLKWLKSLLSDTMQVVYIDTREEVRRARAQCCQEEFNAKDKLKMSRGADRVKEIADLVLDNNSDVDLTIATLQSFARRL